jgi:hypothetical protein
VEALGRWHYEMSHLPRAINLPYEFVDEAEKVLPDKRVQIVVFDGGLVTLCTSSSGGVARPYSRSFRALLTEPTTEMQLVLV